MKKEPETPEFSLLEVDAKLSKSPKICYSDDYGNIRNKGRACKKCNKWKTWENFGKRKTGKNGRSSDCKPCLAQNRKESRSTNKRYVLASNSSGINLELTLMPTERFWSGMNKLLDLICEQELRADEEKFLQEYKLEKSIGQ